MIPYLLAFSWGILILLSLIGWGGIINRICLSKKQIDWGQKAAWGVALSTLIGGILNLTYTISTYTILIYLGAGFFFWLVDSIKSQNLLFLSLKNWIHTSTKDKFILVGILALCFILLFDYASWISANAFNGLDDYNAYFVFPNKMLQLGSMGPDPFSERRMTSLGGQSFLHTFVLVLFAEKNFYIIDPGIANFIVVGLIFGYVKEKNLSIKIAIFISLFFLLFPAPRLNSTSLIIALALFISLFRTLNSRGSQPKRVISNAFIIALTAAAICSLKSNLIPAACLFLIASYSFYIVKNENKKEAIYELLATAVLGVLFLLPWMISMYQSSGTLLFPLLGKGYHGSSYGVEYYGASEKELDFTTFINSFKDLISWELRIYFISLLCFSILGFQLQKETERNAYLSLLASSWLATSLVAIVLRDGNWKNLYRYTFSFTFALMIISMIISLASTSRAEVRQKLQQSSAPRFIALFLIGILSGNMWHGSESEIAIWRNNVGFGRRDLALSRVTAKDVEQYARLQQAIPAGEKVLARLDTPFLLDFRRNDVLIAGWPGSTSPPPGMPVFKDAEALADYLVSQSIQYVAYSYTPDADFSTAAFKTFLEQQDPKDHRWLITVLHLSVDFQENLEKLKKRRKVIYDDGEIFVLDLAHQQ